MYPTSLAKRTFFFFSANIVFVWPITAIRCDAAQNYSRKGVKDRLLLPTTRAIEINFSRFSRLGRCGFVLVRARERILIIRKIARNQY